eukprot:CFRG5540T1
MAEAHQAAHLVPEDAYKHVKLVYDEDEYITIRVNGAIFSRFYNSARKQALGVRNELRNSIFPHSLASWVISVTAPPLIMASTLSNRVPVFKNAHNILWRIASSIPGGDTVSRGARIGLTSAVTGTVIFIGLVFLRRWSLRGLLGYRGWMYETSKPSWKTWLWGVGVKMLMGKNPLLYSFQRTIPRLPVPTIKGTVNRYLASVKPVFPDELYQKHVSDAEEFVKNEGPKLNRYLTLKSWLADNYVTDWWEKYVYLRGRTPIMINSNYYVCGLYYYEASPIQVSRAANLCFRALQFKVLIDEQALEPTVIRGIVPMCMAQYERTFSTTRIPGKECDELLHLSSSQSRHIAVLSKGSWFALDMYHRSGEALRPFEIETQLERIIEMSDHVNPSLTEQRIPALTAGDRSVWAEVRSSSFKHGINRYSLSVIESAMFCLVLDETSPETSTEEAYANMHGDGANRWFDKSFNLIVYANGKSGMNVEHSWADAPVIGHLWEYMCVGEAVEGCYTSAGRCVQRSRDYAGNSPLPKPSHLQWSLNDKKSQQNVSDAYEAAQLLINDLHLSQLCFDEFGKGLMKQFRVSPDGFLQQALQLAFYKIHKKNCLTYESAMTRTYQLGRTETVRPATAASSKFVKSMTGNEISNVEKLQLFRDACGAHVDRYRDAMSGRGVDRHLFALYIVSQGLNVDSKFLNDALSEPWRLSTSQQPQKQTDLWDPTGIHQHLVCAGGGFGPVADNGYGVSYMVAGEDLCFFHVSSKRSCSETDSDVFGEALFESLRDIREMFNKAKAETETTEANKTN